MKKIWLAAAGVAVGGVLLASGLSTMAQWQQHSQVTPGDITSGTLGLGVGNGSAQTSSYDFSALSSTALAPGAVRQSPLMVKNTGTTALNFTLKITAGSSNPLDLTITVTPVASQADCPTNGPAPPGASATGTADSFSTGSATYVPRALASGATQALCVHATVGQAAQQGSSATPVLFTFTAQQSGV